MMGADERRWGIWAKNTHPSGEDTWLREVDGSPWLGTEAEAREGAAKYGNDASPCEARPFESDVG